MGQIWSQIEKLIFLEIWNVPRRISMATIRRGTFMCGLHSMFCEWASLLFASLCSVCSCVALPCVFASPCFVCTCMASLSAVCVHFSQCLCGVRLQCQTLLHATSSLTCDETAHSTLTCVTLIMHGTWHGAPCYAYMCQGTHIHSTLCGNHLA